MYIQCQDYELLQFQYIDVLDDHELTDGDLGIEHFEVHISTWFCWQTVTPEQTELLALPAIGGMQLTQLEMGLSLLIVRHHIHSNYVTAAELLATHDTTSKDL